MGRQCHNVVVAKLASATHDNWTDTIQAEIAFSSFGIAARNSLLEQEIHLAFARATPARPRS